MQGDENISIILIGDLSPLVEFDEFVSSAGVDNLDPVQVLFDIFAKFQGNSEHNILFHNPVAGAARINTTVARINNNCINKQRRILTLGLSRNARERDNYQYKKGEPSHRHELAVFVQPESIGKAPEGVPSNRT